MKILSCIVLACAAVIAAPAMAQQWPAKTVTLVVPYPPGGNVDGAARIIAPKLQERFGQPFVIENRSGAGGLIGAEYVARAAPDGYTLFIGANGPILFAPTMAKRKAYEWRKDFAPISTISLTPLVLQVHPAQPANTLKEFFEHVRKQAGAMTMASPGPGTTNHLLSELIQSRLGLKWVTAHYKGNAPATADLLAGHVGFNFDQVSVALPYIKSGRTRALAVTGASRASWLPDVPTFVELGYTDIVATTFTGMLAPAGTPQEVTAALSEALKAVLADADVQQKFNGLGAEASGMTPEAFTEFLAKEDATWMPIVQRIVQEQ